MAKFSRKPSDINNNSRLRRHTPIVVWFSVGMVLLVLVLPSALNLPQANPTTISEYAPVPPDDNSAPPGGNLSSLGLSSSRLGSGVGESEDASLFGGSAKGRKVATKRCVGNPARQTEDPNSPPCVAYFEGDNGGATAKGVTRDEVVILVYKEGQANSVVEGAGGRTSDYYFDMGKPQTEEERNSFYVDTWRAWQTYFNERYQTYGRFVHIWVHLGSLDWSPQARHADVADAAAKLDPFAVVAAVSDNGDAYVEDWARRGKPVFLGVGSYAASTSVGMDQSFYQKFPGKIWSVRPSLQQWADQYSGLLCAQIVPHRVSFAGDLSNGQPRRIGLLGRRGPGLERDYEFGRIMRKRIEDCGGTVADEQYVAASRDQIALQVASMRQKEVTTIVFTTGAATNYSNVIGGTPWRPEWIVIEQDNISRTSLSEDHTVFRHARHFTTWPRADAAYGDENERPCAQANTESGEETTYQCLDYQEARMLFTGIQVAGPRLTPQSIDLGFHRIPAKPSQDPKVPACFFVQGDYSCFKDAQRQWWDPADSNSPLPGCWKSMEDGKRYLADSWPVRDLESLRNPQQDGCNLQGIIA